MTRTATTTARLRTTSATAADVRESMRLAAIDVGSNSVHMVVAQADADGGVTTLWRMKEMVGLGRMSFPSRRLSREAMDRAIAVLARFKQAAMQRQSEKIIAVATSAIREAVNGGDFIERVKRELGLWVRIVSARDEARLIYLAVRHAVPMKSRPHLIIDVGGGSVEFIVGDERRAVMLESRKLGAAHDRRVCTFRSRRTRGTCRIAQALRPRAGVGLREYSSPCAGEGTRHQRHPGKHRADVRRRDAVCSK